MSLIITASNADAKTVSRLLLYLRDWEYGEDPTWDRFDLLTTETPPVEETTTVPPIPDFDENAWAGKSIQHVEKFCLEHSDSESTTNFSLNLVVVVDDHGMRDQTCIIMERIYDYDAVTDQGGFIDKFQKMRLPWEDTYITWCNLDLANMGFEDFCDMDKGDIGDGWMEYKFIGDDRSREVGSRLRDPVIKELEKLGHA